MMQVLYIRCAQVFHIYMANQNLICHNYIAYIGPIDGAIRPINSATKYSSGCPKYRP